MIISWNTTNQCNMYCDHCYRESGKKASEELNTKQGKTLIEEIKKAGFKIMIFSGGEPFLRNDIFELLIHAKRLGLRPVLGTNGTLIDLNTAKELKNIGVMGVGISLDSLNEEKHDNLRKFPGAWKKAIEGMENCKSIDLPFQTHTTVMGWNNHEVEKLTDFSLEIGAKAHHFFFLVPTGRAKNIEQESLRAREYDQVLTKIMKKQKDVDIELKPTCAPQFMRIAKELGLKPRYSRGCLAGISYCIIGPSGQVQPCAYLDRDLGNVKDTPFSEIWKENKILKELRTMDYTGGCGSCSFKRICGGCRARSAYYNNGDFMSEEPWCLSQRRKGY
ncbi:putative heme d1 biosynthesis radical SAM protein NirJ2 [Proteinivorax tanatarense]|uniref:Heme d1 biosynthesis radical SAM protein NirJ2 n=1 Tax=Proteinivorax tanatarense TaxID=1260629 RepID=A0AAU7VJP2_9FIRM